MYYPVLSSTVTESRNVKNVSPILGFNYVPNFNVRLGESNLIHLYQRERKELYGCPNYRLAKLISREMGDSRESMACSEVPEVITRYTPTTRQMV